MPIAADIFYSGDRTIRDRLPVILVHGAGSSHLYWPRQMRQLASRQILAIDLPGHGRAAGSGCDSLQGYADSIVAFMDAMAMPRAAIIGHSMGGAIALLLALSAPGRVAGLGLISTGAKLRVNPALLTLLKTDPNAGAQQVLMSAFTDQTRLNVTAETSSLLFAAPSETIYQDFVACDSFDIRDRLTEIHVPTAVIAGSQDAMTPIKYSTFLAEGIAGAVLTIIPGAGHMVTLEQPLAVASALTRWLSTIPSIWV